MTISLGRGLDPGTMNIVSALKNADGKIETKRMRDVFLDLPASAKKMLRMSNTSFMERDGEILILGDAALEVANIFGREARRPLSAGLISSYEIDSLEILSTLIASVLDDPREPGEICYYSVPGNPVDVLDRDIIYHTGVLGRILEDIGYKAIPANEAMGVIYAETAKDGFSALGISWGSGMTNVALSINTIEAMSFSVAKGGDSIDVGASKSVGSTQARMCAIKEKGVDLKNPQNREEEALSFYYQSSIRYVLEHVMREFQKIQHQFSLPRPIPIVLSGGTSQAGNFLSLFEEMFEEKRKKFPFEVSEIRMASDPMNAVAHGMLVQALQEYIDD